MRPTPQHPTSNPPHLSGDVGAARPRHPEQEAALNRFHQGDETERRAAFQSLARPHLEGMMRLARRLCGDPHWAEDLVQEALVRAYTGLPGFRGEGSLRGWMFRIVVNLAAEPRRWRRQDNASSLAERDVPDQMASEPEQGALDRELRQRLDEAMERLSPKQRTALHLRAVEGLDYKAIAGVLDTSPGAARMLVLAARKRVLERTQEYLEP